MSVTFIGSSGGGDDVGVHAFGAVLVVEEVVIFTSSAAAVFVELGATIAFHGAVEVFAQVPVTIAGNTLINPFAVFLTFSTSFAASGTFLFSFNVLETEAVQTGLAYVFVILSTTHATFIVFAGFTGVFTSFDEFVSNFASASLGIGSGFTDSGAFEDIFIIFDTGGLITLEEIVFSDVVVVGAGLAFDGFGFEEAFGAVGDGA